MPDAENVSSAEAERLSAAFIDLERLSQSFGRAMTAAFRGAAVEGRRLDDVLRGLALRLSSSALTQSLRPLERLVAGGLGTVVAGLVPFARGGVLSGGRAGGIMPFAAGGVIASPVGFPLAGGAMGLAGEAGPEAILPLARGRDGRLGVRASGGGRAPAIVVNIATPDAQSFRQSEAQITAALARAVARSRRTT